MHQSAQSSIAPVLLTWPEVLKATRLSERMARRLIADGKFPAPLRIGERRVRFRAEDVQAWARSYPTAATGGGNAS
ncbi:helix-turn-helix domain-containing protein [Rubrivivax sp. JA1026]|uniref:helix-turn-helix transcriptional regulator n=1 Tax=Rubrivivax sp. JA1026 TaxID=2710888 RepID=UPI0013E8F84C